MAGPRPRTGVTQTSTSAPPPTKQERRDAQGAQQVLAATAENENAQALAAAQATPLALVVWRAISGLRTPSSIADVPALSSGAELAGSRRMAVQ